MRALAALLCAALVACDPMPDLEAERQTLLDLDVAFMQDVAAGGAEAWTSYFAEDGRMFAADGWVVGREAILEHMTAVFSDSTLALRWKPDLADVSMIGDMGYTIGTYRLSTGSGATRSDVVVGTYLTIWRKEADGTWKVAVDIGNP